MSQATVDTTADQEIDLEFVQGVLDAYKGESRGVIIPILQKVQVHFGYLPIPAVELVSKTLRISMAQLIGVSSFYAQFRMTPRGKYMVKICCGTACHVKGAQRLVEKSIDILDINPGDTSDDMLFTTERVACIGACSLAPVITVNDEAAGYLDVDKFSALLDDLKEKGDDEATETA